MRADTPNVRKTAGIMYGGIEWAAYGPRPDVVGIPLCAGSRLVVRLLLLVCLRVSSLCASAVTVDTGGNHGLMSRVAGVCAGGGGIKSLGAICRRPRGPLA